LARLPIGRTRSDGREHYGRDSDHVSNLILHFMFPYVKKNGCNFVKAAVTLKSDCLAQPSDPYLSKVTAVTL
jgi:hypothetical protein